MAKNDPEQIQTTLQSWAKSAIDDATALYLFGSLIFKNGVQFIDSSDIDLVVVLPELDSAIDRWRWQHRFSEKVNDLEMTLFRLLKRTGMEPIVSIVAVTEAELRFDIHKDGHREFFTANLFRDLITGAETEGLPSAGADNTDRFVAGAFSFAQKVRNDFFAVSANSTTRLSDYAGVDPLPKPMMRAAAMAARASKRNQEPGAEHDVKEGLEVLSNELYERRSRNPAYRSLQDLLAVRRLARGTPQPVDPADQLLLAEIIYDLAADSGSTKATYFAINKTSSDSHGAATDLEPSIDGSTETSGSVAPKVPARQSAVSERMGSSTAFFSTRFTAAFPGVRSISWFTESDDIAQRMLALLRNPLRFPDGLPVWYWRGGNLQIEDFRQLSPGLFLMDSVELRISRIAAVYGSTYKRHFVYVYCEGMKPTGLYPTSSSDRDASIQQYGYDYEEYGLVAGTRPVTRSQYDDGAAIIDGQLTDLAGKAELRVRYTTPYNFLIAANGSPINNVHFDATLVSELNQALLGSEHEASVVEHLRRLVEQLPLRDGAVS